MEFDDPCAVNKTDTTGRLPVVSLSRHLAPSAGSSRKALEAGRGDVRNDGLREGQQGMCIVWRATIVFANGRHGFP